MRGVHVVVRGLVQGVGFRAWVEREALAHGLSGWVRNRRDGTVEAVLAGDSALEDMLRALRAGPPAAVVSDVVVRDWREPVTPGFEIRATG
jgi:acylphosphatase